MLQRTSTYFGREFSREAELAEGIGWLRWVGWMGWLSLIAEVSWWRTEEVIS